MIFKKGLTAFFVWEFLSLKIVLGGKSLMLKNMIVFAAAVPHPPLSISGIGMGKDKFKLKKTISAFEELRLGLEKLNPDTVIIISPHGEMDEYHFVINSNPTLKGNYADFNLEKVLEFKNDNEIYSKINYSCELIDHFVHLRGSLLDYGALVPLDHLLKNIKPKVVHLSVSLFSYEKHYEYGAIISNVLKNSEKRIAIIASGELSHRLTVDSPAGYYPDAKAFDYWILDHLANDNVKALTGLEKKSVNEAAECGLRSFLIMLGAIHQEKYKFNLLSYETPLGAGYLVARFI